MELSNLQLTTTKMSFTENKVNIQESSGESPKKSPKKSSKVKEIYTKESIRDVKELLEELFDSKFTLKTSEKLIRSVRNYETDESSEFIRLELANLIPQKVVRKLAKIFNEAVEEDETSDSESDSESGSDSE